MQPYVGSPLPPYATTAPAWLAVSRGVALFLATFLFLQLFGDIKFGIGSSDRWWIDLAPLTAQQANGFLAICGAMLFVFALKPNLPGLIRGLGSLVLLAWAGFLGYSAYRFYLALHLGEVQSRFPVAFSLHLLAMLTVVFAGLWKTHEPSPSRARDFLIGLATMLICFAGFPIAQMYCYGYTDHRREADAIAVFGCRAYADGTPSTSLRNRVLTGAELYNSGLAPVVILSGGPGEGEFHETAVMKQVALEAGVPESAIVIDEQGWDTADTISNISTQFAPQVMVAAPAAVTPRILAVSNFYHLPRIRLAAERAGLDCATVPATETAPINEQALTMGREVAALWWYHVEPVTPVAAE
ncbi:MAG: hypothetical protein CMJ46_02350 [Planctomyces sp.]|nr:hypothetical protein [Planctomyces sp.]